MSLIQRLPVAAALQRDHLADDRQRDLFRGLRAEIETGRRPDSRQSFARNAVGRQVIENEGSPMMAGNECNVPCAGFHSLL